MTLTETGVLLAEPHLYLRVPGLARSIGPARGRVATGPQPQLTAPTTVGRADSPRAPLAPRPVHRPGVGRTPAVGKATSGRHCNTGAPNRPTTTRLGGVFNRPTTTLLGRAPSRPTTTRLGGAPNRPATACVHGSVGLATVTIAR